METITNKELEDFKNININLSYLSEEELLVEFYKRKIFEYKNKLKETDYKAIKYIEGLITEEEYLPIKEERQSYRDMINEYEELIKELERKENEEMV